MFKYRIDSSVTGVPWGETAFGCEALYCDERESVYHKWCGIRGEGDGLYVLNRGTYGGSFTDKTIKLSLLRTPTYSGHPIPDGGFGPIRQIAPKDRMNDHIDVGVRSFSYRITTDQNIDRQAQIFNESPRTLSFFPSGEGEKIGEAVALEAPQIILSSVREDELVLHNTSDKAVDTSVTYNGKVIPLHFEHHELKILHV